MKKLRVFLISLIGIILLFTNNSYATAQGSYVASTGIGTEKIILLGIGIIAIILVLFIGYKMDKKEENKKRREKFIKDTQNSKEESVYSSIYNPNDVSTDKNVIEEKYIEEENEAYIDEDRVEEENEVEESYNDVYRNEEETIEQFEDNINDEKNEIEDEDFFETYEEYDDENLEEYDQYEDTKEYDEETILEEDVKISKTNRKIEDMINVFESSDTTMVFNSQALKDENNDTISQVKGYDYEDDDDLTELENTIKEANIRKYFRNKEAEKALKNAKQTTKKYTRKKDKQEKNIENTVKRYTRKKVTNNQEIEVETVVQIEKPKRGRPKKSETVQKPKRGRPKKTKTVPKLKRGRPRKTDIAEKPKRGRPKKATSNTTKTTKK